MCKRPYEVEGSAAERDERFKVEERHLEQDAVRAGTMFAVRLAAAQVAGAADGGCRV